MTYYDVLNVSEHATLKEIKHSYYQLSRKYHPDKNNGDDTMFKKISEAYEILSNTEKRRQYDFQLKPMDTMMFRPQLNINIQSMFQNMDHLFSNMDHLFSNNISSESVSISTIIENGVKKTKKVTIKDGVKKVEEYEEPYDNINTNHLL